MRTILAFALVIFLLTACASRAKRHYESRTGEWLGKPEAQLVKDFGEPTVKRDVAGSKKHELVYNESPRDQGHYWCRTIFTISETGVIEDVKKDESYCKKSKMFWKFSNRGTKNLSWLCVNLNGNVCLKKQEQYQASPQSIIEFFPASTKRLLSSATAAAMRDLKKLLHSLS